MRAQASGGAVAAIVALLVSAPARAEDKNTEAAAEASLAKAREWYTAASYEPAISLLRKAARTCGTNRCTATTRAAVQRDLGAILLRSGDPAGAAAAFDESLKIEPKGEPHATYESAELRAAWTAARDEISFGNAEQPSGDFLHVPAAEETPGTPLPIYTEYAGSARLAKVILKYKGSGMSAYRQMPLPRRDKGWSALVPCADVTRGVMRYYLVGLDAEGNPVASSGDPRRPFFTRIRAPLRGEPPHLPGAPPPTRCSEDEECERGQAGCGMAPAGAVGDAQPESPHAAEGKAPFTRLWIGAAASIDFIALPTGNDACKITAQGSSYYCTTPAGADYPSRLVAADNDALVAGGAGHPSGLASGNVRVMVALDYALSANLLVGARVGYVARRYPGDAATHDGKAFSIPLHLEARGTFVFGPEPLSRVGGAPFAFVAGGISEFDAGTTVQVTQRGIVGQRPMVAWATGGPVFVAVGGGARYALSARSAFTAGAKLAVALGPSGILPMISPEIALQYGF